MFISNQSSHYRGKIGNNLFHTGFYCNKAEPQADILIIWAEKNNKVTWPFKIIVMLIGGAERIFLYRAKFYLFPSKNSKGLFQAVLYFGPILFENNKHIMSTIWCLLTSKNR